MESVLILRQLRWAGHVSHMEDTRMPKAVLYSELCQGEHNRSGPIKHFKDQLKQQLTAAGIDTMTWELRATDKNSWRSTAKKAALRFDNIRHQTAQGTIPAQSHTQVSTSYGFQCLSCHRTFLFSHQQAVCG
ncbi:hypothetical protein AAFF_G00061930 [Aldrovandia affinis]|uniref:Uncharacterized protein n=1 Tax=Aldrovandia affinis TaxID=143900 RepID=A0AAD7RZY5_9TELE|nr:hypothetical protein AAFF_G00061930 [Aldrovandia affinis]